jgi:hypothetical protein
MVTGISLVIDPEVPISSMVVVPVGARLVALQVMVTFALPFAGGVTGLAEAVAETSVGNSFTLNVTAEWNPPVLVMVRVVDTVPLSSIVNEEGDKDKVKFFVPEEALTVRAMVVLAVRLPDVPVMVTVDVPAVAVALAVSVNTLVPVVGLVPNAAVTPLGSPDAASVTLPVNPFLSVTEMVLVPLLPWVTVRLLGEAESVKLGDAAALTVRAIEVVAVRLPEVPVMVTVAAPVVAVLLAVSVSTLVPVVGFVPNAAVTPLGKPDAASVTLPVNPPTSVTEMVLVPLLPCVTVKLLGEAESVKLGDADPAANRLIIPVVFGLPQPVHRS